MKQLLTIFTTILASYSFAQNTFPTTGNVGIGTTSPSGLLHVNGHNPSLHLTSTSEWAAIRGNSGTWLFGYLGTAGNEDLSIGTQDNTGSRTLTLAAGGRPRLRISSSGNIGVGTLEPDAFDSWSNQLVVGNGNGNQGLTIFSGSNGGHLFFADGVGGVPDQVGRISYTHSADKMEFFTNNSSKLTINSIGNVGIGTNQPSFRLHLKDPQGGAALAMERGGKWWRFDVAHNAASKLFIGHTDHSSLITLTDQGLMGIGTTSPGANLEISSNADTELVLRASGGNNDAFINFFESTGNNGIQIGQDGTANLFYIAGGNPATAKHLVVERTTGNVGVGTTSPSHKLEVAGTIRSKEVKVEAAPWPDYVFEEEYELPTIEEIEKFIQSNKHLPEVPSAAEVEAEGLKLGEMNALLLKKVEELTLYTIQQEKKIEELEAGSQKQIEILLERIQKLEGAQNE